MPKLALRTCIFCRTIRPQKEMIRLTPSKDHQVLIDEKGKLAGRGAYLCSKECLKNLLTTKSSNLNRAFRQKVLPPQMN